MADLDDLLDADNASVNVRLRIDIIYSNLVKVLHDGANLFVPAKNI